MGRRGPRIVKVPGSWEGRINAAATEDDLRAVAREAGNALAADAISPNQYSTIDLACRMKANDLKAAKQRALDEGLHDALRSGVQK